MSHSCNASEIKYYNLFGKQMKIASYFWRKKKLCFDSVVMCSIKVKCIEWFQILTIFDVLRSIAKYSFSNYINRQRMVLIWQSHGEIIVNQKKREKKEKTAHTCGTKEKKNGNI